MSLFGTSGIRGVVGQEITEDLCREVGQALGTILPRGGRVCLATDTRVSGGALKEAIFSGLLSCGVDVTDLGILPTPALAMLTRQWGFHTGIMVTASHNPPEFNGIKLFNKDSIGYSQDQEREVDRLCQEKAFRPGNRGSLQQGKGMLEAYLSFIRDRLPTENPNGDLRVVVDAGNGAASGFASTVLGELGINVLPLNDTPDGLFPRRSPEPTENSLRGTVEFLREMDADLAVCFDGDADRVVFCDTEGFWGFNEPTAFISRLAAEESRKKTVASTVESGKLLDLAVEDLGAEVVRGKVGDVHLAHLTRETGSAIGTEQVGVYIMPKVGYYPDSIFASLVLLSRIKRVAEVREFFERIPRLFFDKDRVPCPDEIKGSVMNEVKKSVDSFGASRVNNLDGIRLEYEDSWMLIRASGTEPVIRVIAESTRAGEVGELLEKGIQTVKGIVDKRA